MKDQINIKKISYSSIQYIIIQKEIDARNPIYFSMDTTNEILNEMIAYPRDFLQFDNQERFFEISMLTPINPAINILMFDDSDFLNPMNKLDFALSIFQLDARPTVYLIDSNCSNVSKILDKIQQAGHNLWYYKIYGTSEKRTTSCNNRFYNLTELFYLFKADFKQIKRQFLKYAPGYSTWTFKAKILKPKKLYDFNPLKPNYSTLHQISEETWSPNALSRVRELSLAGRPNALIETVKSVDKKHVRFGERMNISFSLPILVLVVPFFSPSIKNMLLGGADTEDEKLFSVIYGAEQTLEYNHVFDGKDNPIAETAGKLILQQAVKPKTKLLDAIAYLHSSFTFSPTLRIGAVGTSIYTELSFLNPQNNRFDSTKVRRGIFNTIQKFGNKLSSSFTKETAGYLQQRNGQILVISDLPVEWLFINGVPLSFTHDVCRIPESNYRGAINNYSAHNKLEFSINPDTISKTLVILSADVNDKIDHEFRTSYELVKSESTSVGFQYRYCKTIGEVSEAVIEINPDILIFDCHGDVDAKNDTSYLIINGERLYNKDIAEYRISAPIVFLSCCNSNPNYGYLNKLHDAFFQAGAITVTSTFLPISAKRGTRYYIRLLNMLKIELERVSIYKNWLEFVSYIIRTSIVHEPFLKIAKSPRSLTEEEQANLVRWLTEMGDFSKRAAIFKQFANQGLMLSQDLKITIQDSECEFLSYSHYGRADMISFSTNQIPQ